jgi:hypothetical protein
MVQTEVCANILGRPKVCFWLTSQLGIEFAIYLCNIAFSLTHCLVLLSGTWCAAFSCVQVHDYITFKVGLPSLIHASLLSW